MSAYQCCPSCVAGHACEKPVLSRDLTMPTPLVTPEAYEHLQRELARRDLDVVQLQAQVDYLAPLALDPNATCCADATREMAKVRYRYEAELGTLRARLALVEPVIALARRWCNRPIDVTRGWLANDAELFTELHRRIDELLAADPREASRG